MCRWPCCFSLREALRARAPRAMESPACLISRARLPSHPSSKSFWFSSLHLCPSISEELFQRCALPSRYHTTSLGNKNSSLSEATGWLSDIWDTHPLSNKRQWCFSGEQGPTRESRKPMGERSNIQENRGTLRTEEWEKKQLCSIFSNVGLASYLLFPTILQHE